MPGTGYIIKTTAGERGPFSTEQIREFTAQGKLQPGVQLRDAARGHSVSVAEVLDGRARIKAMAVSTADILIEDVPGAPSLAPPPATGAPGTGALRRSEHADRQSSSRRTQVGRASSARRGNETSGSERGRQSRERPAPVALYIAIAIAIVGALVLITVVKTRHAPATSAPAAH